MMNINTFEPSTELSVIEQAVNPAYTLNWVMPVLSYVPEGYLAHQMTSDMHRPHLRAGDHAIVDLRDLQVVPGELYLFDNEFCREPMQVLYRGNEIWLHPLWRPKSSAQLERWLANNAPIYTSDGPFKKGVLEAHVLGRVVGVYRE